MLRKTIEIATPGTRLSVAHRQLVIERPEQPKATLPIEDIGVLIVDDRARDLYAGGVRRAARGRRDGDGDRAGSPAAPA